MVSHPYANENGSSRTRVVKMPCYTEDKCSGLAIEGTGESRMVGSDGDVIVVAMLELEDMMRAFGGDDMEAQWEGSWLVELADRAMMTKAKEHRWETYGRNQWTQLGSHAQSSSTANSPGRSPKVSYTSKEDSSSDVVHMVPSC